MGQIVTVAQQKGGAGKTTLAAQLAIAFQAAGRRVALCDTDPQGSLAEWHRRRVAAGQAKPPLSRVTGWRAPTEVAGLARAHDLVLVDSPPHAEDARAAIRSAALVLVPVQPSPVDLWAIAPTLEAARAEKVPVLVVLNRVPPRNRLVDAMTGELERLAQGARARLAVATLGNRIPFATSFLAGAGVIESDPKGKAAEEIRALAAEVTERLSAAR